MFVALCFVAILCTSCSSKRISWLTFPVEWGTTNSFRGVDMERFGFAYSCGNVNPSPLQIGFREDGVVIWRTRE